MSDVKATQLTPMERHQRAMLDLKVGLTHPRATTDRILGGIANLMLAQGELIQAMGEQLDSLTCRLAARNELKETCND